jgi:hypothetical protein
VVPAHRAAPPAAPKTHHPAPKPATAPVAANVDPALTQAVLMGCFQQATRAGISGGTIDKARARRVLLSCMKNAQHR